MFCWNWYGFSHVRMITHKDRTFDNILLVGAGMCCCKFKQLGSLRAGLRDLLGVGQKLILDPYFVSARWFSSRGVCLPRRLGKECRFAPPCAATWWSRDPVTCLYMCMCVWTICHAWVKWQRMRLCYIMTFNGLYYFSYGPMKYFFGKK